MWYYILSCFFYLFIVNNRKNRNIINSDLYIQKNDYNQNHYNDYHYNQNDKNDTSYDDSAIIHLKILNNELQKILYKQKNNTRYQIREYNKKI